MRYTEGGREGERKREIKREGEREGEIEREAKTLRYAAIRKIPGPPRMIVVT